MFDFTRRGIERVSRIMNTAIRRAALSFFIMGPDRMFTACCIEVFQGTAHMFIPGKFSDYLAETVKDVRLNSI